MNNQIYFCNKKSVLLDKKIVNLLLKHLKFKLKFDFKIQNIVELNNQTINGLVNNPHLVTYENNGGKFLLFLTTLNNKKYCLFIDYNDQTKLKVYSVKLRFNEKLYKGTLFNGELVLNNKDSWVYLISDIYYISGKLIKYKKFSEKIQIMTDILKNLYKFDDFMNSCHIQLKPYFLYSHFDIIKDKGEYNRKILFVPEFFNMPLISCKIESSKISNLNTNKVTIFEIRDGGLPDVYKLYVNGRYHCVAGVSKIKTRDYIKKLFLNKKNGNLYIKCKYNIILKTWVPIIE